MNATVRFRRLNDDARLPEYAHAGDSGMDVFTTETWGLRAGCRHTYPTGLSAEIPPGFELQVRPRSGMAARGVVAMFGTVDQGYVGEIGVTLCNLADTDYAIFQGAKIAQLVLAPVARATIEDATGKPIKARSERGKRGFGSTGAY